MTTTANPNTQIQAKNGIFSDNDEIRAKQVAAAVAARKAMLAKRQEKAMLAKLMFDGGDLDTTSNLNVSNGTVNESAVNSNASQGARRDFKQIRVGGAKGKEGRADQTRGKMAFKRPCTVGWKSQNQPLMRGGGNRTPL